VQFITIPFLLLLLLLLVSCDSFKEGVENYSQPSFETKSDLMNIDCSALVLNKNKISKVKFFKNGNFLKQASGFEIQKVGLCPKLSYSETSDRITLEVSYGKNSNKTCRVAERRVICD
jgi:hypothetical protein